MAVAATSSQKKIVTNYYNFTHPNKKDGKKCFVICSIYLEINLHVTYSKCYTLKTGSVVWEIQVISPYI